METEDVIKVLNRARAEELACIHLYSEYANQLETAGNSILARMFREQMTEEMMHARWLGARVRQLGGTPIQRSAAWCRKRGSRRGASSVRRMIREAAELERREVVMYEEGILACAMGGDIETKTMLEQIVDSEGGHEREWARFLGIRH